MLGTLQVQVWWGNSSLAQLFTSTLGGGLGFPNASGQRGPAFSVTNTGGIFAGGPNQGYRWRSTGGVIGYTGGTSAVQVHAVANRVAVPEPSTIALLALGVLGLGLRRRIKA